MEKSETATDSRILHLAPLVQNKSLRFTDLSRDVIWCVEQYLKVPSYKRCRQVATFSSLYKDVRLLNIFGRVVVLFVGQTTKNIYINDGTTGERIKTFPGAYLEGMRFNDNYILRQTDTTMTIHEFDLEPGSAIRYFDELPKPDHLPFIKDKKLIQRTGTNIKVYDIGEKLVLVSSMDVDNAGKEWTSRFVNLSGDTMVFRQQEKAKLESGATPAAALASAITSLLGVGDGEPMLCFFNIYTGETTRTSEWIRDRYSYFEADTDIYGNIIFNFSGGDGIWYYDMKTKKPYKIYSGNSSTEAVYSFGHALYKLKYSIWEPYRAEPITIFKFE